MTDLDIFIISDSSGETARTVAKTTLSQFKGVDASFQRFPFIQTKSILSGVLNLALQKNAVIFNTLVSPELSTEVKEFTEQHQLYNFDCLQAPLAGVSNRVGITPSYVPGKVHDLNTDYFDRISAMEFAVKNDDGKNPNELDKADIIILGVSRTSKTPLSLYLANKKLKVANIPIGPTTQLPDEIWHVNKKKIFGLANSVSALKKIRQERMIAYGLGPNTPYSDVKHIEEELAYATKLYKQLGCLIINVSNKSIEETAAIIMESLHIDSND